MAAKTVQFTLRKGLFDLYSEFLAEQVVINQQEYKDIQITNQRPYLKDPKQIIVTIEYERPEQLINLGYDWAGWSQKHRDRILGCVE